MGASESRPETGDASIGTCVPLITAPKQGYHVIRVAQGSPAQYAGLYVVSHTHAANPSSISASASTAARSQTSV